jgi:hypothetical protein
LPVIVSQRPTRQDLREIGPVLLFRGRQGDRWRLSALFVFKGDGEPPDLMVEGIRLPVPPRFIGRLPGRTAWRFDFAVARTTEDQRISYGLSGEDERWRFTVPALERSPRLAYATCNGCEDESVFSTSGMRRNSLWADLLRQHRRQPFHLLLLGGDQVYADTVWQAHPALADWWDLSTRRKAEQPFDEAMAAATVRHYADLYTGLWRQAEVAAVLASTPAIMMWDDHDIFDGYGSHPDPIRNTPVYQGVFAVARRHFALFQLGSNLDDLPDSVWGRGLGNFSQGFVCDGLGILSLDLRSEREPKSVLSAPTWAQMPGWLDRFAGCRHLIVMSSVPVAFPSLRWMERLINLLPGQARYEDDLRDQWMSPAHRDQHRRLIAGLADHAIAHDARVSVVSGEVHLAHAGIMRTRGRTLWQFTSSGIVHPPPPASWSSMLERLAGWTTELPGRVDVEFPPLPGYETRFLPMRNFMSLDVGADGALSARWHADGRASEPMVTD